MKWSTVTTLTLLAGTALGAPMASTADGLNIPPNVRDQGDGFYVANYNEAGELNVAFTPLAELTARDPAPATEDNVAPASNLGPPGKDEIVCGPGRANNIGDLNAANIQLSNNAPNGYTTGAYGWVHINGQTSFWCNYKRNILMHDRVISMHVEISKKCGGSASYGYNHYVQRGLATDLVIGRTFTGDHFCAPGMKGQQDVELNITSEERNQGDGFYVANYDEAGKLSVTFTPLVKLPITEDLVARDIDTQLDGPTSTTCGGTSNNVAALDAANVQLANNAPNAYTTGPYGWVHINGQTSFWCNYESNLLSFDAVMGMHIALSEKNQGYIRNLVVGRTFTGDHFCTKSFHGRRTLPVTEPSTVAVDLVDLGDGFYLATSNEAGEYSVKFTPAAELSPVDLVSENLAAKVIRILRKRDGVECSGGRSKNVDDLDWANVQLAKNAEGNRYDPNQWGWVFRNKEVSFFCAYRAWKGSYNKVIEYHTTISAGCRDQAGYGYNHYAARAEADINLSVGRTERGDHFCDKHFNGKRLVKSIEQVKKPVPVTSRSTTYDLSIASHLMFQGDGFYLATLNDDGETTVEFTAKAELSTTGEPIARSSESNAARIVRLLSKRDVQTCSGGFSTHVDDLNWANVQLAKNADGHKYNKKQWGWVHNKDQTSFFCIYRDCVGSYDTIIRGHEDVSNACIGYTAAYGYTHRQQSWGMYDLVIGRTFYGDHFCDKSFHPPRAVRSVETTPMDASSASAQSADKSPREDTEAIAPSVESLHVAAPAIPTSAWTIPYELMYQGDGFYTATFDETGFQVDVNFTPMSELTPTAELLAKARAEGNLEPVSSSTNSLHKRKTICSGRYSGNINDLDGANIQLAHNGDGKTYMARSWGWVHNHGETSYFCPNSEVKMKYQEVIDMHTVLSGVCGSTAYGYDLREVLQGRSLSVGRTFYGDHFCTSTFTPPRSVSLANAWPHQAIRAVVPSTEAAHWPISSDLMFQGDGLYITSLNDETGKLDVKFTPMAELDSDVEAQTSITPSFTAKHGNQLLRRDGEKQTCSGRSSKNVPDLDWANVQLAKAADNADLKKSPRSWVHHNGETSFWCFYDGKDGYKEPYANFIAAHVRISGACKGGSAAYGYEHFEGYTVSPPEEAGVQSDWTSISVGRTFYGDAFCLPGFHPPAAVNASPVEASPRSTTFDPRDQGDGHYFETTNEFGESTIKFTPKAELTPAEPARAPITDNPASKSTGTLRQRDNKQTCSTTFPEWSNSWQDLDAANVAVAHSVNGVHHAARTRSWSQEGKEISFVCAYDAWDGSYDKVIDAHLRISGHCNGASIAYGYDYDNVVNVSIGRTFYGDHICRWDTVLASPSVAGPVPITQRGVTESLNPFTQQARRSSCSTRPRHKSFNVPNLDAANVAIAKGLDHIHLRKGKWMNHVVGDEVSFICPYKDVTLTYDDIIAAHIRVSYDCHGSERYGYDYNGFLDVSIGRTYHGGNFC